MQACRRCVKHTKYVCMCVLSSMQSLRIPFVCVQTKRFLLINSVQSIHCDTKTCSGECFLYQRTRSASSKWLNKEAYERGFTLRGQSVCNPENYLRVPEEPEQVLIQDRITSTTRVEETGREVSVGK
jgi:hypothetical protein